MRVVTTFAFVLFTILSVMGAAIAQEPHRQYVDVGVGDVFNYSWQSRFYSDRYDWFINITSIDPVAGGYQIWYSCGGDEHSALGPICDKFLGTNATVPIVPAGYITTSYAVLFINKNDVKETGSGDSYIKYDDRGVLLEFNDYYGTTFLVIPSIFDVIPQWLFVILIGVSVIITAFVLEKLMERSKRVVVLKEIEAKWGGSEASSRDAKSRGHWVPGEADEQVGF